MNLITNAGYKNYNNLVHTRTQKKYQKTQINQSNNSCTNKLERSILVLTTFLLLASIKKLKSFQKLKLPQSPVLPPKEIPPVVHIEPVKKENVEKKILALLKNPLKSMQKKKSYSPQEFDRVLSNYVGKENVREKRFHINPSKGIYEGRVKTYKMPNNDVYTLESHTTSKGIITRLFKSISDGKYLDNEERLYLSKEGTWINKSYAAQNTHLESDDKSFVWIRNIGK